MKNLSAEWPLHVANWVYSTEQPTLVHFEDANSARRTFDFPRLLLQFLKRVELNLPQDIPASSSIRVVHGLKESDRVSIHIHDAFIVRSSPLILAGQTSKWPLLPHDAAGLRLTRSRWFTTFPAAMAPDENPVHALKAPLNRILGIASILKKTGSDDPEERELYTFLEQSSERLKLLVLWLLNEDVEVHQSKNHGASEYIVRYLSLLNLERQGHSNASYYEKALHALANGLEKKGFNFTLTGGWSKSGHAIMDFIVRGKLLDETFVDRPSSNGWVFPSQVSDYLMACQDVPLIIIQNSTETIYRLVYCHPTVQVESPSESHLVQ